jgi:hypothetical protein
MVIAPDATATDKYHFEILSCKLYIKKVSLMDGLALDIARKLETKPVRYAVRKSMMKAMYIGAGRYEYTSNLFQDLIPRRVVLGLVSNEDYVGNIKKSPFNFQNFFVRDIGIIANGRQYPQTPYDLDFPKEKFMRPFYDMNQSIGFANSLDGNGIPYWRYGLTHCVYVFNLTNSGDDNAGLFDLIRNGSTAVSIKFNQAVPAGGVVLIVMGEADSLIMLDRNRTIASDTTI